VFLPAPSPARRRAPRRRRGDEHRGPTRRPRVARRRGDRHQGRLRLCSA